MRVSKRDPQGFYAALNVSADASPEEIVLSYRFLKQSFHERRSKLNIGLIQEAYDTLSDREKRTAYDVLSRPGTAVVGRPRRTSSRFNSPLLLLVLIGVLVAVLAIVEGPDLRASLVSFDRGDRLSLREDGRSLGEVVAYEADHHFHNGAQAPAYMLRRADGAVTWYPARDLARISKRR